MANAGILRRLGGVSKYSEAWLAALLFLVIALIVIKMPPGLVDFLLALNLTVSVIILLTSMYITRALDFNVFPAMLLVTTLFRVSISIASTRLILSNTADYYAGKGGNGVPGIDNALNAAGHVIRGFGEFVTGGNPVIGIIMFIIITVVQFVIVAQGAGRVSEVAARFTLDAMPGKQMAIDAEFNNRMITPEEAKIKRAELEAESTFYGSMDGAMKFVKGDAIAGIIIIVVNLIGGFIIGTMNGMPLGVAGHSFTVLTVGQGLLEQLPALLVSVAAGMVVTRAASPQNMGSALGAQLIQSPRALGISAIIIGLLGAAPRMPHLPLITLAAIVGATAYMITRKSRATAVEEGEAGAMETQQEEISQQMLRTDPISLEVGKDLADLADPDIDGQLLERLKHVRKRIAMEFGVIAPGVRVRPHPGLDSGAYQVRIKGDLVAEGNVLINHLLGIGHNLDVPGVEVEHTTDPIYHTPAVWVPRHAEAAALEQGLQLFDAQDVVSTHVSEVVKQHLDELLTREEVAELLNMARQDAPTVVQELVPNMLALGQIRQVLQNLVKEQVPIKDLATILNALADSAVYTKNPHELTEHVRAALARKICQRYQTPDGLIRAFTLEPGMEQRIGQSVTLTETGPMLQLDPHTSSALQNNLASALQAHKGTMLDPIVIVNPKIRRHVKSLLERNFAKIVVLSFAEIAPGVQVEALDQLTA